MLLPNANKNKSRKQNPKQAGSEELFVTTLQTPTLIAQTLKYEAISEQNVTWLMTKDLINTTNNQL